MAPKTHYETLGVAQNATQDQIDTAYRRLARQYHPDLNQATDATIRMQEINAAYQLLRDSNKRLVYDFDLQQAANRAGKAQSSTRAGPPAAPTQSSAESSTRQSSGPASPGTAPSGEPSSAPRPNEYQRTERNYSIPKVPLGRCEFRDGAYFISIGKTTYFNEALNELKRRVPSSARSYDVASHTWRIQSAYAPVLGEIFSNFSPASSQPSTPVMGTASPSYSGAAPDRPASGAGSYYAASSTPSLGSQAKRYGGAATRPPKNEYAPLIALLVIVGILIAGFSVLNRSTPAARSQQALPQLRESPGGTATSAPTKVLGSLPSAPSVATPQDASPVWSTTALSNANIRRGPGVNYEIVSGVTAGTRLRLDGYNDESGVRWYHIFNKGWIYSSLVTSQTNDLPYLPAPAPPAVRPPATPRTEAPPVITPDSQQNCEGGCMTYPSWCSPVIKGNVSFESRERIYHVAGQEYYEATTINPAYGERWFCTEDEAIRAGWRKSSQ